MKRARSQPSAPASRVVVYARVSTTEQASEGLSLDVQRARCLDYSRALGLEVVECCEDRGRSGRSLDRPGVQAALALAREHRAALMVYALDRLTRSVRDLGALLEEVQRGAFELVSVTDALNTASAAGRLVVHMLGAVAQWQREAGAERVVDALAHARSAGAVLGRLPLGLKRGTERDRSGRLVVVRDPNGAELRAQVERLARKYERAGGRLARGALVQIAATLNKRGMRTASGAIWRAETVRRVLRSANLVQSACDRAV